MRDGHLSQDRHACVKQRVAEAYLRFFLAVFLAFPSIPSHLIPTRSRTLLSLSLFVFLSPSICRVNAVNRRSTMAHTKKATKQVQGDPPFEHSRKGSFPDNDTRSPPASVGGSNSRSERGIPTPVPGVIALPQSHNASGKASTRLIIDTHAHFHRHREYGGVSLFLTPNTS